MPQPISDPFLR